MARFMLVFLAVVSFAATAQHAPESTEKYDLKRCTCLRDKKFT